MTQWRWEQRDETAFTHPTHREQAGSTHGVGPAQCPAGRRGHGAVPWADRELGEGTGDRESREGREDNVGREGTEGREGSRSRHLQVKLLGTGVAGKERTAWVAVVWLCVCECVEWK